MSDPLSMLRIKTFSEPDPIGSNLSWQQNWLFKDSRRPYINAKEFKWVLWPNSQWHPTKIPINLYK